jgi:hypothetical protein
MALQSLTALANITLQGASSEVIFSNIPSTYRDLIIVATSTTTVTSSGFATVRFNSDSGNNYSEVWMQSVSAPAGLNSGSFSNGTEIGFGGEFGQNIFQVMDYSATNKHKTVIHKWQTPTTTTSGSILQIRSSRWANMAAITTLRLGTSAGSYATGTTFSLYGRIS